MDSDFGSSSFCCHICACQFPFLYSVRMSEWWEPSYADSGFFTSSPNLPTEQAEKAYKNQYSISRHFICGFCLTSFENSEIQIAYMHDRLWRLCASDWYKLKDGNKPAIYNQKKWAAYQKRTLLRMLED